MKVIFKGERRPSQHENLVIFSVDGGKIWANLPLYLDEVNHSPTGFEWGYWGSGPSQLAYAILRTYYRIIWGDDTQDLARAHYHKFKQDMIGTIQSDEWTITEDDIRAWDLNDLMTEWGLTSGSPVIGE